MRYRLNTPHIAHETIDNETIIIDFDSGAYYSLQGVAFHIWTLVQQGHSLDAIVAHIHAHYLGQEAEMDQSVRAFVDSLLTNGLIIESEAGQDSADAPTPQAVDTEPTPFVAPVLEQYTDMQDLLLLDPIHEVDEQGWPIPRQ